MNPRFWHGKRVLVTGHTGFKGSWLSLWLSMLGARVVGYALSPPTNPSHFVEARLEQVMASLHGDVCDLEGVQACITQHEPEVVFHLAAQALVRRSYATPLETFHTNVLGTGNVLEAVRLCPSARAVVIVTSDKCYENREWVWGYRECDAVGGRDPYSSSKGCAELLVAAYRSSYFAPELYGQHGVGVATARSGNVIGGGDWAEDRLVPDLLKAQEAAQELVIRNPSAIRPWQFVLEPLGGYLMLAERLWADGPRFAEAWNFGPRDSDRLTVEALVQELSTLLDGGGRYRVLPDETKHEAAMLRLDCSKALARLGWRPGTTVSEALALVAAWHRQFQSGMDMRKVSEGQIQKFQEQTESVFCS